MLCAFCWQSLVQEGAEVPASFMEGRDLQGGLQYRCWLLQNHLFLSLKCHQRLTNKSWRPGLSPASGSHGKWAILHAPYLVLLPSWSACCSSNTCASSFLPNVHSVHWLFPGNTFPTLDIQPDLNFSSCRCPGLSFFITSAHSPRLD